MAHHIWNAPLGSLTPTQCKICGAYSHQVVDTVCYGIQQQSGAMIAPVQRGGLIKRTGFALAQQQQPPNCHRYFDPSCKSCSMSFNNVTMGIAPSPQQPQATNQCSHCGQMYSQSHFCPPTIIQSPKFEDSPQKAPAFEDMPIGVPFLFTSTTRKEYLGVQVESGLYWYEELIDYDNTSITTSLLGCTIVDWFPLDGLEEQPHSCTCNIVSLMQGGCLCGGK